MNVVGAVAVDAAEPVAGAAGGVCLRAGRTVLPVARTAYEERIPVPVPVRVLPSSLATIVLGIGDPVRLGGRGGRPCGSVLAGIGDGTGEYVVGGAQQGVVLRCPPPVVRALLGRPLRSLADGAVDLQDVLDRDVQRLVARLAAAGSWPERFAVVETWVARRLGAAPPDRAVMWAWRRLRSGSGSVDVTALADRLGWTRRHLLRRFHDQVGVGPRTVARVARFERAVPLLADPGRGLAAVAAEAGYADHAHLTRQVGALTGWTPSDLRVRLPPRPRPLVRPARRPSPAVMVR